MGCDLDETGTVVRAEGFEPPRLASREPKSRASTSSATPACRGRCRLASARQRRPYDVDLRPRPSASTLQRRRSGAGRGHPRRCLMRHSPLPHTIAAPWKAAHHGRLDPARERRSGRGLYHARHEAQQKNGVLPPPTQGAAAPLLPQCQQRPERPPSKYQCPPVPIVAVRPSNGACPFRRDVRRSASAARRAGPKGAGRAAEPPLESLA